MMMGFSSITPMALAPVIDLLHGCAAVEAAYLHGSAVTGRLRDDSDIDIAILPRRPGGMTAAERLGLAGELASIVGRPVDLGLLSTANVVFAKEVITTGCLIFERDHPAVARFAMLTLSMYASLQEARREVLRAYAA